MGLHYIDICYVILLSLCAVHNATTWDKSVLYTNHKVAVISLLLSFEDAVILVVQPHITTVCPSLSRSLSLSGIHSFARSLTLFTDHDSTDQVSILVFCPMYKHGHTHLNHALQIKHPHI